MARIGDIRVIAPSNLEISWIEGRRSDREGCHRPLAHPRQLQGLSSAPRRRELFSTARLIEQGDVVAWDGADLEIQPADLLEALAEETMTSDDFPRVPETQWLDPGSRRRPAGPKPPPDPGII